MVFHIFNSEEFPPHTKFPEQRLVIIPFFLKKLQEYLKAVLAQKSKEMGHSLTSDFRSTIWPKAARSSELKCEIYAN